jgi:hypothetical protein
MSFDMPLDSKVKMLIEIDAKLEDVYKNIKAIKELNEEHSYLLRLILAVNAANAGLVKSHESIATEIKNTLADVGIKVEVAEPHNDPQFSDIRVSFSSNEDSTAYILSGNMRKNDPNVIELTFGDENKPCSDAQKIRWLQQYQPDQIDVFRHKWESSSCKRDKIALKELDRLLPLLPDSNRPNQSG